jgi:hypothetical protein
MVAVPAVLTNFIASRILKGDRRDPAEPYTGSKFARTREVVEDGDTVMPPADCVWIILIPPHSFAKRTMRFEVVERWCRTAEETE